MCIDKGREGQFMKARQEELLNFFIDNSLDAEDKSRKLLKRLMEMLTDGNLDGINKLYNSTKALKYSGQGYIESIESFDEEEQKVLTIGYAYALVDVMQIYIEKLQAEKEILQIRTKYRDTVLKVLAERGTMFHKDLAAALRVSASGLNAIIKQMNATSVKLINVEEISKYKIYSLTPKAYQYVKKNNPGDFTEYKMKAQNKKMYILYEKIKFDSYHIRQDTLLDGERDNIEKIVELNSGRYKNYDMKILDVI